MDNINAYAVVLTFPKNLEEELENLRRKYNKSVYEIVPHITLKMPFKLLTKELRVIEALNKVAVETETFEIELNGLAYFNGALSNVVYVALKDNSIVSDLHKKIVFALKGLVEDIGKVNFELDNFIPHATIGESISNDDIKNVKQELLSYNPVYKINIDSFSLYNSKDNIVWSPTEKFELTS